MSNTTIIRFLINPKDYAQLNSYCYQFHIYDIISHYFCLSFEVPSNVQVLYQANTTSTSFNRSAICNMEGKCVRNLTSTLEFCKNANCSETTTAKQIIFLNEKISLIHKINELGESLTLTPIQLIYKGNGVSRIVSKFEHMCINYGQTIVGFE